MKSLKEIRKRSKSSYSKGGEVRAKKKPLRAEDDEEIPSDIESDLEDVGPQADSQVDLDAEIEIDEDPGEKNLRLAKKYLAEIQELERERSEQKLFDSSLAKDDEEEDQPLQSNLATVNKYYKRVADSYEQPDESKFKYLRNGHRLAVTCVAISPDASYLISGGKDGRLIKWDLKTYSKVKTIHEKKKASKDAHEGHTGCITALSIPHDGKFLASGDTSSGVIFIWDPSEMKLLDKLEGHRSSITGLTFRRGSHNLYSCSHDRSVKSWNIDEMSYIETMYGHQEPITAIDSIYRERAITAGGRDSSIRLWKVPEESQLVFQASPGTCVDTVKFLDNQHFVSGADDGSISLWGLMKKKPLTSVKPAHSSTHDIANWICSVASLFNTDIFASGSCDSNVRIWKAGDGFKKIEPVFCLKVEGFINSLDFSCNGDLLAVAVGKEHKMGRWWSLKHVKNQIVIVPLSIRK